MQNKTILVTGASRGLGRQMVEHYAQHNDVIGLSRSGTGADHARVTNLSCDVTNIDDLDVCIETIFKEFPSIDVLINNAAVLKSTPLVLMKDEDILSMIQTNLVAPILLTKRMVRAMMRQRRGHIVNIVSMSHKLCKPGDSVYAATKAGLEIFGKVVNVEAHSSGISVNNLAISASPTGMLEQITQDDPDKIKSLIPHNQFAKINDIVSAIDFFCSPDSGDIGGQTVFLGGI
ncbi:MAG: SDR family oxidoreductase [Magnetovibrio sp.]|nr:SDR family oxidoreductase [Magnetovibrio sp.]